MPPVALPVNRHGINSGTVITATTVSTSMTWPAASDDLSGVASYWLMRSANDGSWGTITSTTTARSAKRDFVFGTEYRFRLRARDRAGNIGAAVDGPVVKASLVQEATSLATYTGAWTTASSASASGGKLRFTTTARRVGRVRLHRPLDRHRGAQERHPGERQGLCRWRVRPDRQPVPGDGPGPGRGLRHVVGDDRRPHGQARRRSARPGAPGSTSMGPSSSSRDGQLPRYVVIEYGASSSGTW